MVCQHLLRKEKGARKLNIEKGATSAMGQRHVGGQGGIYRHYVNQAIPVQTQFYWPEGLCTLFILYSDTSQKGRLSGDLVTNAYLGANLRNSST